MRIGDATPAAAHYQSPAEEMHACVLEAFESSSLFDRLALADALERGTEWARLPASVRGLFEGVARQMGISDP